jgi:hypothetical protein
LHLQSFPRLQQKKTEIQTELERVKVFLQQSIPFDDEHNANIQIQKGERKNVTCSVHPPVSEIEELLRSKLASTRAGDEQLKTEVSELRTELAETRRVEVPLAESQITSSLSPDWKQFKDENE